MIHDEQSALTSERIADIAKTFAASRPGRQLSVRQVDSRGDARVQLADFVAGLPAGWLATSSMTAKTPNSWSC